MKTEQQLDTLIIAKIFAQYLGQTFRTIETQKNLHVYGFCYEGIINIANEVTYKLNNVKAILKPLSAITDEDALEVGQLLFPIEKFTNNSDVISWVRRHIVSKNFEYNSFGINWFNVYQFLQSKGYDLPHYLLGGKTLFESGLAVYE